MTRNRNLKPNEERSLLEPVPEEAAAYRNLCRLGDTREGKLTWSQGFCPRDRIAWTRKGREVAIFEIERRASAGYVLAMNGMSSPPLVEALAESMAACLDAPSLQAIAGLRLDATTQARLDDLADKANEGQITSEERAEYLAFVGISEFLGLAQLRARTRLGLPLGT
jgi:hypothetical protein